MLRRITIAQARAHFGMCSPGLMLEHPSFGLNPHSHGHRRNHLHGSNTASTTYTPAPTTTFHIAATAQGHDCGE